MNNPVIVGIDVSEDISIAVRLTYDDYKSYPSSKAKDFFDICDLYEIKNTQEGIKTLLELGDIFCFEPTGRYSINIENSLLEAGKEIRIIKNNMITAIRKNCGWDFSDDEHDAVAIAYDGWRRHLENDLGFYNRIRIPELEKCYQLFLSKERLNRRIRPLLAHAKNLLHSEAPCLRKVQFGGEDRITPLWTWIAGREVSKQAKTRYLNKLKDDIGTFNKTGTFSQELKILAASIDDIQRERARIREEIKKIIDAPKFRKYNEAFSHLQFGVYERAIILCQVYPFEQFLTPDFKELRTVYKRKKTKNGHPVTKRVGYRHFHCLMGRGLFEESSGQTTVKVVRGNAEIKLTLMQWATTKILREKAGKGKLNKGIVLEMIEELYWQEADPAYAQLKSMLSMDDETLSNINKVVPNLPQNRFFKDLIKNAIENKKKPSKALKSNGVQSKLKDYLLSRATDKAIKILWKILLCIWQEKEINPKLLIDPHNEKNKR